MASDDMLRVLDAPSRLRVAVASDQHLVEESVRAALHERGHETIAVRWPVVAEADAGVAMIPARRARTRSMVPAPDVAVLLSELTRLEQLRSAQLLLRTLEAPCLVMAGASRGPVWGALYDSGATLVVPTQTGLDELCVLLGDVHDGHACPAAAPRPELVRSWRSFARQYVQLSNRIETLTCREEEVLQQLHEGLGVRAIAERGEVSEATVRSQVKAILRKLDVNSQLAAVAAYQQVRRS
jgi:DNA-binding NarL/FixJ family response regulator